MGRPRGFDRERVLDHVVDLFWRHGYDGTSVEAIRHATGIGPSSLYAAFGDKRTLFFEAVDRYRARVVDKALDGLEQDRGDGLAAIRAFFTRVVDGIIAGERRWGCLMTNCAVERAPWDEAAAALRRAFPDLPAETDDEWLDLTRATFIEDPDGRLRRDWDKEIVKPLLALPPGDTDLWSLFKALKHVPTGVVRGARSDILSTSILEAMIRARPDLIHAVVPDVGHPPNLKEQPAKEVIDAVLARV
mgnify:CR=1 FL=1